MFDADLEPNALQLRLSVFGCILLRSWLACRLPAMLEWTSSMQWLKLYITP